MRRFALLLLASAIVPMASRVSAADEVPQAVLTKPQTIMLGDAIATTMTQFIPVLKANEQFTAEVLATFDREANKIQISVYGTRTSVDEAKAGLENFRGKLFPLLAAQVAQVNHVAVTESDLVLVYYDRVHGFHEVVRREGTKYLVNE